MLILNAVACEFAALIITAEASLSVEVGKKMRKCLFELLYLEQNGEETLNEDIKIILFLGLSKKFTKKFIFKNRGVITIYHLIP